MTQLSMLQMDTPQPRGRPAEPILREAVVDGDCRFVAKRAWGAGPCVLWAMTNPSLANGLRDDPSMWRVMSFSYRWGYGCAVVVNIYPFVTPSMKALDRWRLSFVRERRNPAPLPSPNMRAWNRNLGVVSAQVNAAQLHVAAWGSDVDPADLKSFLSAARIEHPADEATGDPPIKVQAAWHVLGLNKDESPRHPLARGDHRVPDDQRPILAANFIKWAAAS